MKIMFYINEIRKGGAERVVTNLCNYFSSYNEVILLTTRFFNKLLIAFINY